MLRMTSGLLRHVQCKTSRLNRFSTMSLQREYASELPTLNAQVSLSATPTETYEKRVEAGLVHPDPTQRMAVSLLEKLHHDCIAYEPLFQEALVASQEWKKRVAEELKAEQEAAAKPSSWFSSIFGGSKAGTTTVDTNGSSNSSNNPLTKLKAPQSLYMWGTTGCGKTYLMDLFYEGLPVKGKARLHFHDFMILTHKRMHALKQQALAAAAANTADESLSEGSAAQSLGSSSGRRQDAKHMENSVLKTLAAEILAENHVLCFDEFQVTDIADAMILRLLFEELFAGGLVLLATSNRPPQDLYKDGLQRDLFVPFIHLLEERSKVFSFVPPETQDIVDYRLVKFQEQAKNVFFQPLNPSVISDFNKHLSTFSANIPVTSSDIPLSSRKTEVTVYGHSFKIPHLVPGRRVACFSFDDLCANNYGAADYIALGETFGVVAIRDIHRLKIHSRNELRRFITLIDSLYESKSLVLFCADAPAHLLLDIDEETRTKSAYDEIFAFDRAVSRMLEMQSIEYVRSSIESRPQGVDLLVKELGSASSLKSIASTQFASLWDYYYIDTRDEIENGKKICWQSASVSLVDLAEYLRPTVASGDALMSLAMSRVQTLSESKLYLSRSEWQKELANLLQSAQNTLI